MVLRKAQVGVVCSLLLHIWALANIGVVIAQLGINIASKNHLKQSCNVKVSSNDGCSVHRIYHVVYHF